MKAQVIAGATIITLNLSVNDTPSEAVAIGLKFEFKTVPIAFANSELCDNEKTEV